MTEDNLIGAILSELVRIAGSTRLIDEDCRLLLIGKPTPSSTERQTWQSLASSKCAKIVQSGLGIFTHMTDADVSADITLDAMLGFRKTSVNRMEI